MHCKKRQVSIQRMNFTSHNVSKRLRVAVGSQCQTHDSSGTVLRVRNVDFAMNPCFRGILLISYDTHDCQPGLLRLSIAKLQTSTDRISVRLEIFGDLFIDDRHQLSSFDVLVSEKTPFQQRDSHRAKVIRGIYTKGAHGRILLTGG